jgi:DNA-binding CsgD family transcriptional regulator
MTRKKTSLLRAAESHLLIHVWEHRAGEFVLTDFYGASYGNSPGSHPEMIGRTATELLNGNPDISHDLISCHKNQTAFRVERTLSESLVGDRFLCPVTFAFIPTDIVIMISDPSDNRRDLLTHADRNTLNPDQCRLTLRQKDIALRQILNQIGEERECLRRDLRINISYVVLPLLEKLKSKLGDELRREVEFIGDSLMDATSEFIGVIQNESAELSPRELQICDMIRKGLISKEIAASLCISVQTVDKTRQQIRRKLGLQNTGTSLVKYLNSRLNGN